LAREPACSLANGSLARPHLRNRGEVSSHSSSPQDFHGSRSPLQSCGRFCRLMRSRRDVTRFRPQFRRVPGRPTAGPHPEDNACQPVLLVVPCSLCRWLFSIRTYSSQLSGRGVALHSSYSRVSAAESSTSRFRYPSCLSTRAFCCGTFHHHP